MRKSERQQLIKTLIAENNIERQEDFVKILVDMDIKVTQATVSRDIKDMQLVKVPSLNGGYHYSLPVQKQLDTQKKFLRTLNDAYISSDSQDKMLVLQVQPGNGPALATLISQMNFEEVFCTIGDDSTVLTICKSQKKLANFKKLLMGMLIDQ